MRMKSALGSWAVVSSLVLASGFSGSLAEAAPKKWTKPAARTAPKAAPKAEAPAAESEAASATPAAEATAPAPAADAATAPAAPTTAADGRPVDPELGAPPTTVDTDPKLRPSPLTPRPEEMPGRDGTTPDYSALLSQLVALQARVSALNTALYDSKLRVTLETDGDDSRYAGLTITIDGGVVYTAPERFAGTEETVVFEHSVAPGPHVIGVEVERYDGRSPTFRSWQATRYSVDVVEKRILQAHVMLSDDSDLGDFAADQSGRYDVGARLDVEVVEP
jgi:hypothetical protein